MSVIIIMGHYYGSLLWVILSLQNSLFLFTPYGNLKSATSGGWELEKMGALTSIVFLSGRDCFCLYLGGRLQTARSYREN